MDGLMTFFSDEKRRCSTERTLSELLASTVLLLQKEHHRETAENAAALGLSAGRWSGAGAPGAFAQSGPQGSAAKRQGPGSSRPCKC